MLQDPWFQDARKQGEEVGITKGEITSSLRIARNLLESGEMTEASIAKATGLSLQEVQTLKKLI